MPEVFDVLKLLHVDLDAGRLFWRRAPWNHPRLLGREAGCPRLSGGGRKQYWVVKSSGKAWKRAHLIFTAAHGFMPRPCVDHIDGDSLNDAASNLRSCSITENAWNHKTRKRTQQLPMGVRTSKNGRFVARIGHNKTLITIGSFDTIAEAQAAYLSERRARFGDFA